jgi:hypothetical protein
MWQGASDADREVIAPATGLGGPKENTMSVHADPYTVAAEVAWRRESLGAAGLAGNRRPTQLFRLLPWGRRPRHARKAATHAARHTARHV